MGSKERKEKQDSERERGKSSTAAKKINATRLVSKKITKSQVQKFWEFSFTSSVIINAFTIARPAPSPRCEV